MQGGCDRLCWEGREGRERGREREREREERVMWEDPWETGSLSVSRVHRCARDNGWFGSDYLAYLMIFASVPSSIALVGKRHSIRVSRRLQSLSERGPVHHKSLTLPLNGVGRERDLNCKIDLMWLPLQCALIKMPLWNSLRSLKNL